MNGDDGDGGSGGLGRGVVLAGDFAVEPGEVFANEVALALKLGEPLGVHVCERRGGGEMRKKKKRRGCGALK